MFVCVWDGGWGVDGGWMPLPTHPHGRNDIVTPRHLLLFDSR